MLFRGNSGHGLEPVGKMGRALFQRPVLHGGRHRVGDGRIQALIFFYGFSELLISFFCQALSHYGVVKYMGAKHTCHGVHGYIFLSVLYFAAKKRQRPRRLLCDVFAACCRIFYVVKYTAFYFVCQEEIFRGFLIWAALTTVDSSGTLHTVLIFFEFYESV